MFATAFSPLRVVTITISFRIVRREDGNKFHGTDFPRHVTSCYRYVTCLLLRSGSQQVADKSAARNMDRTVRQSVCKSAINYVCLRSWCLGARRGRSHAGDGSDEADGPTYQYRQPAGMLHTERSVATNTVCSDTQICAGYIIQIQSILYVSQIYLDDKIKE